MKSKLLTLAVFLTGFLTSSAFAVNSQEEANGQTAPNSQVQNQNQQKDGEIIAWLIVLNQNEIDAAKQVANKNVTPIVKKYAHMMQTDHSKNLHDTMALSHKIGEKPVQTDDVITLKQQGKNDLASMKQLPDQKLQKVYIDNMVNGHEQAIKGIDQKLAVVSNPELKQHLEATRTRVQAHLKDAQGIQQQLNTNS